MKSCSMYSFVSGLLWLSITLVETHPVVSELKPVCESQWHASLPNSAITVNSKWEYSSGNIYIMEIGKQYKSGFSLP